LYLTALIQPCIAPTVESKTENTADITTDLISIAVAASIAPEDDLPILYKNYNSIHSRLAQVYAKNGYMPTSISSSNAVIDPTKDEAALLQYLLANVLITKSYEMNEMSTDSQKKIIDDTWKDIEDTDIGPVFYDVLIKQMILKGYVTESSSSYDALEYADFNEFYDLAATTYVFDSQDDIDYLRKQYFSGYSNMSRFDISMTGIAKEDYREYNKIVNTINVLQEEYEKYQDSIITSEDANGNTVYSGATEEEIERFEAIEATIEKYEDERDSILAGYETSSSFDIEYFTIGTSSTSGSETSTSNQYLTIPLSILINNIYQNQDSTLIWKSALFAAYYQKDPHITNEEWASFNQYVIAYENLRALEIEYNSIRKRINYLNGGNADNARTYVSLPTEEKEELNELKEKKTNLLYLKSEYTEDIENYEDELNLSITYDNSKYYINGISPFYSGYYDWNLVDTIANCLYYSAYNNQVKYDDGIYTKYPTSLLETDVTDDKNEMAAEIEKLNDFKDIYINSMGRMASTIEDYPDDVRAYSADQLSDLYLVKAEFHLKTIQDGDIRNAVYLAALQEARKETMAIPYKKIVLNYDSNNKPSVSIFYTKSVDVETFNNIIEDFSENSDIDQEMAVIANWNQRTTAEYLIKMMYGTSSVLSADIAISNLINQRASNLLVIPITTSDLATLLQNPLITIEQKSTLQTLLNDNALELAKTDLPLLQDLRFNYVDMYYEPIAPESETIFNEYYQWENDDTVRSVSQTDLTELMTDINTFKSIYTELPNDTKENYEIPYDEKALLPLFGNGQTKYSLAKTVVKEDIQTTPEFEKVCKQIVKEYELNKIKSSILVGAIALLLLLITFFVVYKYWYSKRANVKIDTQEHSSEYEIRLVNKGYRQGSYLHTAKFNSEIISPSSTDPTIRFDDIGSNGFTISGVLAPQERKVVVARKASIETHEKEDNLFLDMNDDEVIPDEVIEE
jgi:hypothetical protein